MNRPLDVLFVVAGEPGEIYQGFQAEHHTEPSAAARFCGAYSMRRGLGVRVVDGYIHELSHHEREGGVTVFESVAQEVIASNPRLVVMLVFGNEPSSSTMTMPSGRKFAQAIKNLAPDLPIIFVGPHPAALPERTLQEEPTDFVCDGEGPMTIYELAQTLKDGGSLAKVHGLCHLKDGNGALVRNQPAPLIDLNQEPALIGWQLMDPRQFHHDAWHGRWRPYADRANYANPFSMLGCPFHCEFCMTNAIFRTGEALDSRYQQKSGGTKPPPNSFRYLRPELFVDEVVHIVETFGTQFFKIPDEMFALQTSHVARIGDLLHERLGEPTGSSFRSFWCYARIDTVQDKPRMHEAAVRGGIDHFGFGIEGGAEEVRSGQDKNFGDDRIWKVKQQLITAGIRPMLSNFIFGLPGDTPESMRRTYELACELNPSFGNFYCAQALPGSALHRRAMEVGYPLPEREGGPGWIGYAQYSRDCEPFFEGTDLTPHEILKFRDWAHVDFHTRSEFTQMLLDDPEYGEIAVATVDRWLEGIRNLKRKPEREFPKCFGTASEQHDTQQ